MEAGNYYLYLVSLLPRIVTVPVLALQMTPKSHLLRARYHHLVYTESS